ncbi:MAG: hypothetical protein H8E05_00070 [Bacteroidetes bacterium]|nr:hypothetical protein [Bacteroidota bacterium]
MSNHEIIKKVFELTQIEKNVKYWDREEESEKLLKQIEELIANERPAITGPKWKEIK